MPGTKTSTPKRRRQPKRKPQEELPDLRNLDVTGDVEPDGKLEEAIGAMEATQGGTSAFGEFDSANSGKESMNKAQGTDKDSGKWGDSSSQAGISVTAGVLSTFDLALDVTRMVKVFMDGESTAGDKAGAVLSTITGASKVSEGVGAIVKVGQENAGASTDVTEAANSIMGEITGILSVINAGYTLVKNIVTLVQKGTEMDDMEKRAAIGETVKAVLDAGKGTIEVINKFMEHLGTVSGPMLQAAPGIGIAIGVLDVIMNGVNIGYSYVAWSQMRDEKREFKAKAKDHVAGKTRWGGNKSYEKQAKANVKIAEDADAAEALLEEKRQLVRDSNATITQLKHDLRQLKRDHKAAKSTRQKQRIQEEIDKKEAELEEARKAREALRDDRRSARTDAKAKRRAADAKKDDIENSREYLLAKQLQYISAKRIRRGVLNIGLALPGIAGDIAVLSGAGAAVGAGLKAGAGGGKLLALAIRMGKQAYHNARGDEKSTANKAKTYDRIIRGIIRHMEDAHTKNDPELKARALREISATGLSTMAMKSLQAKGGAALYQAWVKALKQR